jgi:hypothetical protein
VSELSVSPSGIRTYVTRCIPQEISERVATVEIAKALYEVAAQLAESNERDNRNESRASEMLEMQRAQMMRMFGDDKPVLYPGTVVRILTNMEIAEEEFGICCPDCGRIHTLPKEEAERLISDANKTANARPQ